MKHTYWEILLATFLGSVSFASFLTLFYIKSINSVILIFSGLLFGFAGFFMFGILGSIVWSLFFRFAFAWCKEPLWRHLFSVSLATIVVAAIVGFFFEGSRFGLDDLAEFLAFTGGGSAFSFAIFWLRNIRQKNTTA